MVSANSGARAWIAWDSLVRYSARSAGDSCGKGPPSAALAAATARSTSPSDASGTRAITSSVVGLITSMVAVDAGAAHSPPM
jgi:hypothetical protein